MAKFPFTTSEELSQNAKRLILQMTTRAQASHVGSALSVVDILSALYFDVADISPESIHQPDRDVVILSKGHAASALYSILALGKFFPESWLEKYCENDQPLGGHVSSSSVPGVELSTGSLGHGLPYGLGIALSRKMTSSQGRTFVVISDGECDEGTTWESALLANHHGLNNLCVIIDRNRLQSLTSTEETLRLEPLAQKWEAFGWDVKIVDGHDHAALATAMKTGAAPTCVIAETVKGKGVDFMENSVLWHYRPPSPAQLEEALSQIDGQSS